MENEGTYITFTDEGPSESKKTRYFRVNARDGSFLGRISWFGRWRKYCFFPDRDTIFEQVCLREIANFIEQKTKQHKSES